MKPRRRRRSRAQTLTPFAWPGAAALNRVHLLNQTGLAHRASQYPTTGTQLWSRLDARSIERAARMPMLLIDLDFQRPDRWTPKVLQTSILRSSHELSAFVRDVLHEASFLARTQPLVARLVFDMAPAVIEQVAVLSSADIEAHALHRADGIRLKWQGLKKFWDGLLLAALGEDDKALSRAQLHGLQLLARGT